MIEKTIVWKTEAGRSGIMYDKDVSSEMREPISGVIIPNLRGVDNLTGIHDRLHVPFTNSRGETLPWIRAFLEAARCVIAGGFSKTTSDRGARNDFCPAYSYTASELLSYLGIPSVATTFLNGGFYPEVIKMILSQAVLMSPISISPELIVGMACSFAEQRVRLSKGNNKSLLAQVLSDEQLQQLDAGEIKQLLELARFMASPIIQSHYKYWQKIMLMPPLLLVENRWHQAAAFRLGEELALFDINGDQNNYKVLNAIAELDESHRWTRIFGVNPLRDMPVLVEWQQGVDLGYYSQWTHANLIKQINSKTVIAELPADHILISIFNTMITGKSMWDEEDHPLSNLRTISLALNRARTQRFPHPGVTRNVKLGLPECEEEV